MPTVVDGEQCARWSWQPIVGYWNSVRRIGARCHAWTILPNEAGSVQHVDAAAVVTRYARGRRLIVMVAFSRCGIAWWAPEPAQQRRLRSCRQRQHDQKGDYSKHDTLDTTKGKKGASVRIVDQEVSSRFNAPSWKGNE